VRAPEDNILPDVPTTAVAAAGMVVILGTLATTGVGKWSLMGLFVPLYTKLKKNEILDQFTRGKIYGYILANPGDHYNSIQNALGLPNGTFAYHLHVLEKEGYIRSARYGTRRCFFPANMRLPEQETVLKAGQRLIIERILEEPGISQKEIADSLGVSSATVSYHIKGLLEMGVVQTERMGMRLKYYINREMIPSPI
jgi:predicted transcriptional regulator